MTHKEKTYQFIKDNKNTPFSFNEIMLFLRVDEKDKDELKKILDILLSEKKIILTKKKRYKYNKENDFFCGEFIGNDHGYGFIRNEDFAEDFFVSFEHRKNALNKDIVKFKIISEKTHEKRACAVVTEILKRNNTTVVGTFYKNKNFGFVVCDDKKIDKDIFIPKGKFKNAQDNQKVVVKITDYGKKGKNPEGIITEVIGFFNENGNDVISVIKKYDLPYHFPGNVIDEAELLADKPVKLSDRMDLRDKLIITIDGDDSKDFDDAISLKKTETGYILGVHIADVSYYVKEGSVVDKEAYKRGTSVYLADRVIPMLPKCLSNGICSLNPNEDRYTLSVFLSIDNKGKVLNAEFFSAVINSKYRMTYNEVTDILENGKKCDKSLKKLLNDMKSLALILRENRRKRGSLDFNFPECKIIFDSDNKPIEIKGYELSISNYIIEEFMLAANEAAAQYIYWQNKPMIYRIHEKPDPDKMDKFKIFVRNSGFNIKNNKGEIHSKSLLKLLDDIKGDKCERIIQTIMLRSLMKARYSEVNKGHFGLASDCYCHFTSPIRRYPDLIVHRLIKLAIAGRYDEIAVSKYLSYIPKAALSTSEREITAQEAERECEDIKKAIYMQDKIGMDFEGTVSSVTSFGFFVELDNTVEGLVRYSSISDDYFIFDESTYTAIGERTGVKYTIGDRVNVTVTAVNPELKEIDFEIAYHRK